MPPANSRASPSDPGRRAATPPSYLAAALSELDSPVNQDVLNLAATLTTQAEDEANETHIRPLRPSHQEHEEWRAERARERLRHLERQRDDLDHRDRLRRVMSRLSRIHDTPAYGDRIPSQNSLYDWSPANEADDEDELDQILAELRREQPHTHPEILRVLGRSQLDSERQARMRTSSLSSRLMSSPQPSQSADSSARSAALLQSARRHPRLSARTRDYMQRYNADRDSASRSPHHSEPQERYSGSDSVRQAAMQRLSERRTSLDRDRDRDMLARVDSYRRSYLDRSTPTTSSPMLEQAIKYLSRIRYSNTVDDSLSCALDVGVLSKEYFCEENPDFVLDTFTLPPPAESSWLAPGAVLSGCQHATSVTSTVTSGTNGSSTTMYRLRNNESMTSTTFDPSRPWLSHSYTPPHRRSLYASGPETPYHAGPETVTTHSPQQDRWPVKVTIHSVDYSKMSLSATMEAYNVPSHPHSHQSFLTNALDAASLVTRTSSITTYLEGEILDFNQHTLLTESFKSSPSNDATYWRKLPPFQKFTDEELVRKLTSRRWVTEELNRDWILMRWKERCFVKSLNRSMSDANAVQPPQSFSSTTPDAPSNRATFNASFISTTSSRENYPTYHWSGAQPQPESGEQGTQFDDSGCGLTISGFYYVCLRRSDGKLEGLYYDPQSSPYQCLKLDSVNGGRFPAWSFR
ncbi:vacuolar import and degradation protein-domain-containing protein [Lophiotrema nucula]|uniref:Vacuolar import and degradation protein-domain-containing protein n=1 Tax=Lophiotrema nucula TaxID=690887 RepID=A0A6A5YJG5_9PLEO|nr:vacuolar import and degradation protein-domain-containing protein [Lophiotrema nucula]